MLCCLLLQFDFALHHCILLHSVATLLGTVHLYNTPRNIVQSTISVHLAKKIFFHCCRMFATYSICGWMFTVHMWDNLVPTSLFGTVSGYYCILPLPLRMTYNCFWRYIILISSVCLLNVIIAILLSCASLILTDVIFSAAWASQFPPGGH